MLKIIVAHSTILLLAMFRYQHNTIELKLKIIQLWPSVKLIEVLGMCVSLLSLTEQGGGGSSGCLSCSVAWMVESS